MQNREEKKNKMSQLRFLLECYQMCEYKYDIARRLGDLDEMNRIDELSCKYIDEICAIQEEL